MDLSGLTIRHVLGFLKWTLFIVLLVAGTVFLFRERLFRALFHFEGLHERSPANPGSQASARPQTPPADSTNDVGACIDSALEETADALCFTTGHVRNDAASVLKTGKANCIGYSAVFKDRCEEQLQRVGLSDEWRVQRMRGLLYCRSFNMHRLFSSPFWKDHDICVVENRRTGERVYVDPSLFDALGIRQVSGPLN